MIFKRVIFPLGLAILLPMLALAQTETYSYDHRTAGDRALNIQLGGLFPLFFQDFKGTVSTTHLSPGGTMGINLDFYADNNLRIGGAVHGMVAFSPNSYPLFLVPLTLRASWEFKLYPFSFPVGLGAGFCFSSYRQASNLDPILMPTVGAYWNVNSSWSFGLDATYWQVFQLYSGGTIAASDSRMGHFLDVSLGTVYHF